MSSVLNVDTIADKAGTGPVALTKQSAAKAWMQLNGTGTIAIQGSFNTSSATDNTTGDYQQNYTNVLSNDNYSGTAASRRATIHKNYGNTTLLPTSASSSQVCVGVEDVFSGESPIDAEWVHTALHGDLA